MSDDLYLKGGRFALSFLESRLGAKLIPAGDGLNGRRSVIYVSNHFTRLETVVLPYLIYKYSDDYAASLADKSLFVGLLKKFFSKAYSNLALSNEERLKKGALIIYDLFNLILSIYLFRFST